MKVKKGKAIPGSFISNTSAEINLEKDYELLLYFSCLTLTTLGCGDVVAVSSFAQMLTVLEARKGVMYLANLDQSIDRFIYCAIPTRLINKFCPFLY
jgi:hypothetical protein